MELETESESDGGMQLDGVSLYSSDAGERGQFESEIDWDIQTHPETRSDTGTSILPIEACWPRESAKPDLTTSKAPKVKSNTKQTHSPTEPQTPQQQSTTKQAKTR